MEVDLHKDMEMEVDLDLELDLDKSMEMEAHRCRCRKRLGKRMSMWTCPDRSNWVRLVCARCGVAQVPFPSSLSPCGPGSMRKRMARMLATRARRPTKGNGADLRQLTWI